MTEARTRDGKRVRASEIAQLPPDAKPLTCRYCDVRVEGVGAYFKGKDGPRPTVVAAHFRLDDGGRHADECAYNAEEVLRAIARASQGLAQIDDAGRLRLVLPAGPGERTPARPQPGTAEPDGGRGASLTFTTVRPAVPPALNSAAKIAHFLALHDFDSRAVARFRVLYGDATRPIPWSRFCYPARAATGLHQLLADGQQPRHPVAVHGTVQRVSDLTRPTAYATLHAAAPRPGGRPFAVRLRTDRPALLAPLRPGTSVLAVGTWSLWPEADELRLWLSAHWQLAHWTTHPGTGEPTAIACPPPLPPEPPRPRPAAKRGTTLPTRQPRTAPPSAPPSADVPPPAAPDDGDYLLAPPRPIAAVPADAPANIPPRPSRPPTAHLTDGS
ncbi:hypothetical protein [Kitasatospora sp. NPDC088134]|uniref:hypothetical protein n=1 Tax=Kitasatospora sp. NPDC088134 TaxID=3364071 RepID=UPI00380D9EF5